jgi:hypothetical protein
MADAGMIRTVRAMTTSLQGLRPRTSSSPGSLATLAQSVILPLDDARRSARSVHPARRSRQFGRPDGKIDLLANLESLTDCRRPDLETLASTADLIQVPAGTVLAEGAELARFWWMPVEGWLLAEGDTEVSRSIPTGWSWTAPRLPAVNGSLMALRPARLLVAPVHRIAGALNTRPRLGRAVRATLVGGDV